MTRAKGLKFKITEETIKEAVRNVKVFGHPMFNSIIVAILHSTKRGFPLVGSEEVHIVDTVAANELRRIYIRGSKDYAADRVTAEQFRNAVQPLFDKLTDKELRKQQN
jgi:hypothetical protein